MKESWFKNTIRVCLIFQSNLNNKTDKTYFRNNQEVPDYNYQF